MDLILESAKNIAPVKSRVMNSCTIDLYVVQFIDEDSITLRSIENEHSTATVRIQDIDVPKFEDYMRTGKIITGTLYGYIPFEELDIESKRVCYNEYGEIFDSILYKEFGISNAMVNDMDKLIAISKFMVNKDISFFKSIVEKEKNV